MQGAVSACGNENYAARAPVSVQGATVAPASINNIREGICRRCSRVVPVPSPSFLTGRKCEACKEKPGRVIMTQDLDRLWLVSTARPDVLHRSI